MKEEAIMLLLLLSVYIFIALSVIFMFTSPFIPSQLSPFVNSTIQKEIFFYEGVLDAYANLLGDRLVCRSVNIYRMLKDAISPNTIEVTVYLIWDRYHIRGYFNKTIYDVTSPSYKFKLNETVIAKCLIKNDKLAYNVVCYPIFIKGDILEKDEELYDILKNISDVK